MRAVVGTLGIAVLLSLAAVALQRGWADLLTFQGRSVVRVWDKQFAQPNIADWEVANDRLQRARELDPANPTIAEERARLVALRTRLRPPADPAVQGDLRIALDALRTAAVLRPGSPYTWANIAAIKSSFGQLDAEFRKAVRLAAELGPWEAEVQILLAGLAFRDWERLAGPERAILRAAAGRGMKHQGDALFALAMLHGRLDLFCSTPGVARSRHAMRCI